MSVLLHVYDITEMHPSILHTESRNTSQSASRIQKSILKLCFQFLLKFRVRVGDRLGIHPHRRLASIFRSSYSVMCFNATAGLDVSRNMSKFYKTCCSTLCTVCTTMMSGFILITCTVLS